MEDYSESYLVLDKLMKRFHNASLAGKTKDAYALSISIALVASKLVNISKDRHEHESRETAL